MDYAKGIELIAEEAKKAADGLHTVADIVAALGGSEDAVEVLADIAHQWKVSVLQCRLRKDSIWRRNWWCG